MPAITASMVGALRAKTDAPMMECKKALTEADGDMERAEEILRVKLGSKAGKASSRITAEGVVAVGSAAGAAALVEVNCETDFVSKNDDFLAFANAVAELIAAKDPADVEALAALPLTQAGFGPTVEDVRKGLIGKIGENVAVRRFKRYAGAAKLARYLHGTRIGVLVEYSGDETAAKDVAMHVAAMKPVALSSAEVPATLVEKERSVASLKAAEDADKAKAEGKPVQSAEIVAKRVDGAVQKFLKEVSLFNQPFVIENRGGAGGAVGMETLIRSKPDGYTLCMCASTVISTVSNLRKVSYQVTDADAIAITTMYISGLLLGPKNPATNFGQRQAVRRRFEAIIASRILDRLEGDATHTTLRQCIVHDPAQLVIVQSLADGHD